MTSLLAGATTEPSPSSRAVLEPSRVREIAEVVNSVVTDAVTASTRADERAHGLSIHDRRTQRHEFVGPILVQPLDARLEPADDSLLVEGRDVSAGGLSFHHRNALPQRFAAISFPGEAWSEHVLLAELTWCCFTREGAYRSGGRFVRTI